jgi:uncharacterized SAM-binding protein YcdF (DUF218 family)
MPGGGKEEKASGMKIIVSPFLWFLFLQGAGLLLLLRWGSVERSRTLIMLLLVLTFLLTIISTPLSGNWLKNTLAVHSTENSTTPPVAIFVLAGDYLAGATSDEDVLGTESQRRVLHAVGIWRRYPDAILVFSGTQGMLRPERLTQLMADVALCQGVPRSAILSEPRSTNTREHPIEALKLPGMTSTTSIGIVTSDWHIRRAEQEFRRYFQQVYTYPVSPLRGTQGLQSLMPTADSLDDNTTLIREWVGILWYKILNFINLILIRILR